MSYHNPSSPKIIPRVKLSPKIKYRKQPIPKVVNPIKSVNKVKSVNKFKKAVGVRKSPRKITSPYQKSRSKVFLANKESFRTNPTINPVTNRQIKANGDVYKKLIKLYGNPY
jgi:hypothetical protein